VLFSIDLISYSSKHKAVPAQPHSKTPSRILLHHHSSLYYIEPGQSRRSIINEIEYTNALDWDGEISKASMTKIIFRLHFPEGSMCLQLNVKYFTQLWEREANIGFDLSSPGNPKSVYHLTQVRKARASGLPMGLTASVSHCISRQ
jgi:hypothetical protein